MVNPYAGTSYNQQSNIVEGGVAVAAMATSANAAWHLTDAVREGVMSAMGYGPKGPSAYQQGMNIVRDASVITSLLCSGLYLGSVVLTAVADTWDKITGNSSKQETSTPNTSAAAAAAEPTRDPAYLNSRRV